MAYPLNCFFQTVKHTRSAKSSASKMTVDLPGNPKEAMAESLNSRDKAAICFSPGVYQDPSYATFPCFAFRAKGSISEYEHWHVPGGRDFSGTGSHQAVFESPEEMGQALIYVRTLCGHKHGKLQHSGKV